MIFVISSNLVLASERIKSRKHFVLKSIDFDRFMSSEGTKRLILVLTSKTGHSVEHTRHRIFLFGFFCLREDILSHFIRLISDSRLKRYSR